MPPPQGMRMPPPQNPQEQSGYNRDSNAEGYRQAPQLRQTYSQGSAQGSDFGSNDGYSSTQAPAAQQPRGGYQQPRHNYMSDNYSGGGSGFAQPNPGYGSPAQASGQPAQGYGYGQQGYGAQPAQRYPNAPASGYAPQPYSQRGGGGVDMSNMGSGSGSGKMGMQNSGDAQRMGGGYSSGMDGGAQGNTQYFGQQFSQFQNSAAGQLGMQFGAQALQQGQQIVNQNINRYVNMENLRRYFNVSNSYVLNKIRVLLFPFRQKIWTRLVKRSEQDGQMEGFKPPREDLNAPDLYIPVMAFVTYVLLIGALYGVSDKFKPEALGLTSTSALFITGCEILFFKLGCYLLNVTSESSFLDLIAVCGYKYVPIIVVLLLKLLTVNGWMIYSVFGYLMIAFGFFTLRTLRHIVLPESNSTVMSPQRQRRIYFLFIIVVFQIVTAFFLVYTGAPSPKAAKAALPKTTQI
ncbi:hypothetical protein HDU67_007265 [Dinochytrium kinnereticum]|nr:hypothetical protein HDU67_007265 [Dinochytrium kinnereticum]